MDVDAELNRIMRREASVCLSFVTRAFAAWRRPGSPYESTAEGLQKALLDELSRMTEAPERTKTHE